MMKLLFENWRKYLNENTFLVDIEVLIPTQEQGHGKGHLCPSEECEELIQKKMDMIKSGEFKSNPLEVTNQKPVTTYRLKGKEGYTPPEKSGVAEPFYYVLDGHHRLEAAKLLGIKEIPVFIGQE